MQAGMSAGAATVALSLTSAAVWGSADFIGGIAARRLPSSAVVTLSHTLSLVLLVSLAFIHASQWPGTQSAVYGALAGIACGTGVMVLYKALSLGGMGLTAAVSGVLAAVLPVVWSFSTEGLPRQPQIAGIVLAAVAIWMIARSPGSPASKQAIVLGAASGVSFGCLYVFLKLAGRGGVLWPLACSRMASATLAALVTWIGVRRVGSVKQDETPALGSIFAPSQYSGQSRSVALLPPHRAKSGHGGDPGFLNGKATTGLTDLHAPEAKTLGWPGWAVLGLIGIAGIFDATGNTFYTIATRLGRLDIAAVLSSLYPASTILLAALILKEHTTRSQAAGMALALAAVVLISA
jgi:drug/metabolite transporter (DMT)-like permease